MECQQALQGWEYMYVFTTKRWNSAWCVMSLLRLAQMRHHPTTLRGVVPPPRETEALNPKP